PVKDYLTRKELGIRVNGRESCCVIRFQNGSCIEIGRDYTLPMDSSLLSWPSSGVPGSILAVALRIYELDHPGSELRSLLTLKIAIYRPVEAVCSR
ncbi:MAG: hypothetical protein ACRD4P_14185, partial [Bryobacteraceae bacterium]